MKFILDDKVWMHDPFIKYTKNSKKNLILIYFSLDYGSFNNFLYIEHSRSPDIESKFNPYKATWVDEKIYEISGDKSNDI